MLTKPSFVFDEDYKMGSGFIPTSDVEKIHFNKHYKLRNLGTWVADTFIDTNFDLPFLIHVPKKFIKAEGDTKQVKLKVLDIKDNSQGIKDLKRSLKIKTITSLSDLDHRIRVYNHNLPALIKKNQAIIDRLPFTEGIEIK